MTVFSNDPIRCSITWEEIRKKVYRPPKGINVNFTRDPFYKDVFFVKISCSDTLPHTPNQERHKEDIDRELAKLKVIQDRVRERYAHKKFSQKSTVVETILDEQVFGKENRYDLLIDRAKNVHTTPDGHKLGTIEDS